MDKNLLRQQFVFLLNRSLDITNQNIISGDDLVLYANEVRAFKQNIQNAHISDSLKESLNEISFEYSPKREIFTSSLPLIIVLTIASFGVFYIFLKLQIYERRRILNTFREKYEKKLNEF